MKLPEAQSILPVKRKGAGICSKFSAFSFIRGADKKAEDATSVKELIEMYQQQGKQ